MSRYTILILLNVPIIIAGVTNALVSYKLSRVSRRKFIFRLTLWLSILLAIVFTEDIYNYLFSNNLTQTEPLSLFDVIQITGIILVFFIANQAFNKADRLERRIQELHQELSIKISTKKK